MEKKPTGFQRSDGLSWNFQTPSNQLLLQNSQKSFPVGKRTHHHLRISDLSSWKSSEDSTGFSVAFSNHPHFPPTSLWIGQRNPINHQFWMLETCWNCWNPNKIMGCLPPINSLVITAFRNHPIHSRTSSRQVSGFGYERMNRSIPILVDLHVSACPWRRNLESSCQSCAWKREFKTSEKSE